MIDRISPTLPSDEPTVMRQRWAKLLFLHWPIPAETLRPLIPRELEIDTFEGTAYVGLVPFTMTGLRPVGLPPLPVLSDCHETNVRTYVHHRGRDPGVWFFSCDASNGTAVRIARMLWKLNYVRARIDLARNNETTDYRLERAEKGPGRLRVSYSPVGVPAPSVPGTLQHFLVERYILYTGLGRELVTGRVWHPPYPVQPAVVHALEETMLAANRIPRPAGPPIAHYASEVRTRIHPPRRLRT